MPSNYDKKFTFIDLFAGIGGMRMAFDNLGGECVFSSEYDKFAQITYSVNYGEEPSGDITLVDEITIPDHDILLAGFPCQPFSLAGVSKKNSMGIEHGFLDKTHGTLFFDVARIIKGKHPKAFLLENVKNLLSHDSGNTFKIIVSTLKELGYNIHHKVMDGRHYVPQHRERVIIIGFRQDLFNGNEGFEFPGYPDIKYAIKDILEKNVDAKYTLSDKMWNCLVVHANRHAKKGNRFGFGLANLDGVSRTLLSRYRKDGSEILIQQEGMNPRRLTPRECARLQGFPDTFVIPVSNDQAYKQFGNSVVVPMIQAVGEKIVEIISK